MNPPATSREELMAAARALSVRSGGQFSIRSLAKECGVSVGTIYHYFPDKGALLAALVEEDWHGLFHGRGAMPAGFAERTAWFFGAVEEAQARGGFAAGHGAAFGPEDKAEGRAVMADSLRHIRAALAQALAEDDRLRPALWDKGFTPEALVSLVLDAAQRLPEDQAALLALIRRGCYPQTVFGPQMCSAENER